MPDQQENLRISVISKSDASGGGASRVAEQLATLLNAHSGAWAHHWVGYPGRRWQTHMRKLHGGRLFKRIHAACRLVSRQVGFPDFLTPELINLWRGNGLDYDMFHLHDISLTFSPLALGWLSRRRPVAWTLHDCSSFTGGCLYPMDCRAFQTRCHACPQLGEWPLMTRIDMTGAMQRYKRNLGHRGDITFVAPSRWMAQQVAEAGLTPTKPIVIPNCVDTRLYRPLDKRQMRDVLRLPQDRFIVLLSAWSMGTRRKGSSDALAALRQIRAAPFLLVVGNTPNEFVQEIGDFDYRLAGYIAKDILLAQYYAAADVFLFPSLADNLPCAILETMATATPTIAYKTGGIPEMIDHGYSGWLATPGAVKELVDGLDFAASHGEERQAWQKRALERAARDYNCERFLSAHIALYESILRVRGRHPTR